MASGMSKRFGHNKLTADFNGKTLIENAISESRFVNFKDRIVSDTPQRCSRYMQT